MQAWYKKRFWRVTAHVGLIGCCVWWSVVIAWYALSAVNFAFPLLYDEVGIGENISQFGPRNKYKQGFEHTTRAEHERLFSEIVTAINNNGVGLQEIRYRTAQGVPVDYLLRPPEVVHLQDVANLLAKLRNVCWYLAGLTLFLGGVHVFAGWKVPATWQATMGWIGLLAVFVFLLSIAGATTVFYSLHTRIFPDGHQWFFYYQESLMTTLMKAPDLFGYIAVLIVLTTIVVFISLWAGWKLIVDRLVQIEARTQ